MNYCRQYRLNGKFGAPVSSIGLPLFHSLSAYDTPSAVALGLAHLPNLANSEGHVPTRLARGQIDRA